MSDFEATKKEISQSPSPTEAQEGWEKEFDKKWDGCFSDANGDYCNPQVKDFIQKTISQVRREERESIIEMIVNYDEVYISEDVRKAINRMKHTLKEKLNNK